MLKSRQVVKHKVSLGPLRVPSARSAPGLLVATADSVPATHHGGASINALHHAATVWAHAAAQLFPFLVTAQLLTSAERGKRIGAGVSFGPTNPLRCGERDKIAAYAVVISLVAAGTEVHGAAGTTDALACSATEGDVLGTFGGGAREVVG